LELRPLVESSCNGCHDADTKTPLDLSGQSLDLSNADVFRRWERVFDRVRAGEMPPEKKARPDKAVLDVAMGAHRKGLREASLTAQKKHGRVRARRLTKTEYTLRDLLGIRNDLAKHLPPESELSSFDTVSSGQGSLPVHIRSYLSAADVAIDEAIELGRRPRKEARLVDDQDSRCVARCFDRPIRRGGDTIKKVDDAIVTFDSRPHSLRSDHAGYRLPYAGLYRIEARAYGYQAKTPVTMTLMRGSEKQGEQSSWQRSISIPARLEASRLRTTSHPTITSILRSRISIAMRAVSVFSLRKALATTRARVLRCSVSRFRGRSKITRPPASTR
jgi:hypothetical protein